MRRKAELLFIKYCRENKLDKVQSYLHLAEDLGLDINAVDDYGVTAAHVAATQGHTEVIRMLAATRCTWLCSGDILKLPRSF